MPAGRDLGQPAAAAPPVSRPSSARPDRQVHHPMSRHHTPARSPVRERLGAGLLGGEALGVGLDALWRALGALALAVGEDAPEETLAVRSITFSMRRMSVMCRSRLLPGIMESSCAAPRRPARKARRVAIDGAHRPVMASRHSPPQESHLRPIRKGPIWTSTISGQRRDGLGGVSRSRPWPGVHFKPQRSGARSAPGN
jgi:hypothetical protein